MASFDFSAGVESVARKVITEHHPALAQLKIAYLFRHGAWNTRNRETWATVYKVSDRDRLLHKYDYILVVNVGVWSALDGPTREALIDHELSHIGMDEKGAWKLFGHDLEDFVSVVSRRGAWTESVREYLDAAHEASEQLKLDFTKDEDIGLDGDKWWKETLKIAAKIATIGNEPPERELRLVKGK